MEEHVLGRSGLSVSRIGFGAFKIGRNQGIKYPQAYDLPTVEESGRLLNAVLDLGINLIDTAPAYGLSEERIGLTVADRRDEFVLCTKVGETFTDGRSTYDFSAPAIRASIDRSLQRLRTDMLDIVLLHSPGDDLQVMRHTDAVRTLQELKQAGKIRAIGLSGKTVAGARAALRWADVLMVEYHADDTSHAEVMSEAASRDVGVLVKKGLAAGHLPADEAIRFVLGHAGVSSLVIGGLNIDHIRGNLAAADPDILAA